MNDEMGHRAIDPQLEARLIALLLGEASDFEREELNRIRRERPEVAAFWQEMQDVHGLLEEVGAGELVAMEDEWQLPPERRNKLLAVMRGHADVASPADPRKATSKRRALWERKFVWGITSAAAALIVAALFIPAQLAQRHAQTQAKAGLARVHGVEGDLHLTDENVSSALDYSLYEAEGTVARNEASVDAIRRPQTSLGAIREGVDFMEWNKRNSGLERNDSSGTRGSPASTQTEWEEGSKGLIIWNRQSVHDNESGPADAGVRLNQRFDKQEAEGLTMPTPQSGAAFSPDARRLGANQFADPFAAEPAPPAFSDDNAQGGTMGGMAGGYGGRGGYGGGGGYGGAGGGYGGGGAGGYGAGGRDGDGAFGERRWGYDDKGQGVFGGGGAVDEVAPPGSYGDRNDLAAPQQKGRASYAAPKSPQSSSSKKGLPAPARQRGLFDEDTASLADLTERSDRPVMDAAEQPSEPASRVSPDRRLERDGESTNVEPAVEYAEFGANGRLAGETFRHFDVSAGASERDFGRSITGGDSQNRRVWGASSASGFLPALNGPARGAAGVRPVPTGLEEKLARDDVFSTFSLHVSDVSFKLARTALAQGQWPETAKIRVEEFVNAFDYGDPLPSQDEKVTCTMEQSIHPFLQQRNLLRVSMRTAAAGRPSGTPLRLTLLLDNSGSMERVDRRQTVRRAFALLAEQLTPFDQVTLIAFARQPRLMADQVSGAHSRELVQRIENLPSEGGTNIEAALSLAFEKAREQQLPSAQNRIVLLTDGAVNLGNADPDSLARTIAAMRDSGIAFDAAGISAEGLNDEILEALTRQGDGRYYLLDSIEAADDGFARQIAGALRPSAKNVKVQVEFNPDRVGRYKLLGFEKHRLETEDFRNDQVDAAEMAEAEAGVALYQFEARPDGVGDVGSVSVRFRDLATGQMVERRWPIPYQPGAPRPDQTSPSLRIATSAALLAAKLQGGPLGEIVELSALSRLLAGLPAQPRRAERVQQLEQMIQQARQISNN